MNEIFLLLSAVPGIEARGSSIYFIYSGEWFLIPLAIFINFIAVAVFIKLLEMGKVPGRIDVYMERKLKKLHRRVDNWFEKYGNVAIFLLIALPSTGIGSFTGAFIGRAFGLKGKVFYASILLGIACSLVISFPVAYLLGML
jgi:uncharacterized membrane protein